jgi:hypothetical protein
MEAIFGHKSAHSFATGPVIAEPFVSPLGLTMTPALSAMCIHESHVFPLYLVHTFKINEDTILSSKRLALSDNDGRGN